MKKICLPKDILHCLYLLHQHGYDAYVVGGAIRNQLLHLPVKDYDLASSATPEEAHAIFSEIYHVIFSGKTHGTITIQTPNNQIELTTFRQEDSYLDHRHPQKIYFTTDVMLDSKRRDFTINALYYQPNQNILDFHNGIVDLQHHILRTIGNPKQRFEEDALRILRALRLQIIYHFDIEKNTAQAMHSTKHNLSSISNERIISELKNIIIHHSFGQYFQAFEDIYEVIFKHSFKENTAIILNRCQNTSFYVRIALLLYQADMTADLFKLNKKEIQRCNELLQLSSIKITSKIMLKKILSKLQQPLSEYLSFQKALHENFNLSEIQQWIYEIDTNHECYHKKTLALQPHDLIAQSIDKKYIHTIQNICLEKVIAEELPNNLTILLQFTKNIILKQLQSRSNS